MIEETYFVYECQGLMMSVQSVFSVERDLPWLMACER